MKLVLKEAVFIGTLAILIMPIATFAAGQYTQMGYIKIYSEYYPNPHAQFKGTIIFENGSGVSLTEWTHNKAFFQCAKQYGNLFMYDRNGDGKSPPDLSLSTKNPMTAKLINTTLMKLLKKRSIKPPYILVAHSYGGMYAGYFARKYPHLIKGILMIDPVPNNYDWPDNLIEQHGATIKEINQMKKMSSKEVYAKYRAKADKPNAMTAQLFCQLIGFEQTKKQVNQLPPLSNDIPVIIISSSYMRKNAPIKGDWYQLQRQWLNKNLKSKIMKIHSGHFIQLEHPKAVCKQLKKLTS